MEEGEAGELIPSDPAFWDNFYGPRGEASGDVFEWYLSFEHARECFGRFLSADALVLQVGCGTSTLAQDLLSHKLARHVVSIDSCAPAIEQMQALSSGGGSTAPTAKKPGRGRGRGRRKAPASASGVPRPAANAGDAESIRLAIDGTDVLLQPQGATYRLMDACALGFPSESFDYVVDKGTLDAMLSIGDEEQSCCWRMMEEIARVLKPDGRYLVVSGPVSGDQDWLFNIFKRSGLWDMDDARRHHSPVTVPLHAARQRSHAEPKVEEKEEKGGEGPCDKKKEYFITCSFWALKKEPSSP